MAITEGDVSARLATVVDPNLGKDLVAGKLVRAIRVEGGDVTVDIQLGYPAKSQHAELRRMAVEAIAALPGLITLVGAPDECEDRAEGRKA